MFHISCLKKWFDNVQINRDLTCPHCNTIITDTSQTQNNDLEHESNEVSASIEFDTLDQKLQKNQNVLTNCIASKLNMENCIYKETARAESDECISPNFYQEDGLNIIKDREEVKSLHQIDSSE